MTEKNNIELLAEEMLKRSPYLNPDSLIGYIQNGDITIAPSEALAAMDALCHSHATELDRVMEECDKDIKLAHEALAHQREVNQNLQTLLIERNESREK